MLKLYYHYCYDHYHYCHYYYWRGLNNSFSNSLIIHEVRTKEITTVKEVWIPGPN